MAGNNSSIVSAIKATLVGGAIILVPGFLAVFVLSKVFQARPTPWSGNVAFVPAERVKRLLISVTEALKVNRALGRGSEAQAAELRALPSAQ